MADIRRGGRADQRTSSFRLLSALSSEGLLVQRSAWLPFFDDVDAILFLAPISCFDERLAEDRRVNRLKDSVILWKSIVASKLLEKATLICEMSIARYGWQR